MIFLFTGAAIAVVLGYEADAKVVAVGEDFLIAIARTGRSRCWRCVQTLLPMRYAKDGGVVGINPKWLAELVTEDEYGEPEVWAFHFQARHGGRHACLRQGRQRRPKTATRSSL